MNITAKLEDQHHCSLRMLPLTLKVTFHRSTKQSKFVSIFRCVIYSYLVKATDCFSPSCLTALDHQFQHVFVGLRTAQTPERESKRERESALKECDGDHNFLLEICIFPYAVNSERRLLYLFVSFGPIRG